MRRIIAGMSIPAGQASVQGATQSPTWSEKSSSSAVRRAALISSERVVTTIPSAAGATHEGARFRRPSTLTTQRKHDPNGATPSAWQSVGIWIPSFRAASRIVAPGSTSTV